MTASVFVGTSVDGFIARQNGDLNWLHASGGEPHGYDEFIATVDTIVIGRKTFETVLTFEAWPYGNQRVVGLSSRPIDLWVAVARGGVVEQMAGPPADIVSNLAARGAEHLYRSSEASRRKFDFATSRRSPIRAVWFRASMKWVPPDDRFRTSPAKWFLLRPPRCRGVRGARLSTPRRCW